MGKCFAKDLIKTAKNEVGYLEKEFNVNLDSKTASAGDNNFTKYGKEMGANGQYWCDAFVDWCFKTTFGDVDAKRLLGGYSNYTPTSAQYFKNMGQWYENKPKIGDVVFFHNTERICHTGLVVNVNTTTVFTVEGNTSSGSEVIPNGGGVFEKQYSLLNSRISGYGRPKYDTETEVNQPSTNTVKFDNVDWTKRLQSAINVTVDGKVGNETLFKTPTVKLGTIGARTKLVQEKLTALGYDTYGIDGKCGNDTVEAMKKFQKEVVGMKDPDGEFTAGGNSWKVFLNTK